MSNLLRMLSTIIMLTTTIAVGCTSDDDNDGGGDSKQNKPPILNLGNNLIGNEGELLSLQSASFTDTDSGDSHTASIDWGDGTPIVQALLSPGANNVSITGSHTYNDDGSYIVQICVDDSTAEVCNNVQATVNNLAPHFVNLIGEFEHYGYIGNQLVSVNSNTAEVVAIGSPQNLMSGQFWIVGLTYDPMQLKIYGTAYSETAEPILFSVDHLTGDTTNVGTVNLPSINLGSIESMSFHPVTGVLYANGGERTNGGQSFGISNRLMTVDPLTAMATQVATVTGTWNGGDADSLVIIADTTYVYDSGVETELYTMDLVSGVNTLVAPTTAGCSDMTYSPIKNRIICGYNMSMWSMDPDTANAVVVGNTHTSSEFNGDRFLAIASVPGSYKPIEQQSVFQNNNINLVVAFEDAGKADTFSLANVDWMDGTTESLPVYLNGSGAGYLVASHVYTDAGLYNANYCVTDDDGSEGCTVIPISVFDSSIGLVAYYPFNGSANDVSGNGNDAAVFGSILTMDRHGNVDSAYHFDGVSNYILVNGSNSLNLSDQLSISVWFRSATPIKHQGVIWKESPNPDYAIAIDDAGLLTSTISVDNIDWSINKSSSTVEADTWFHVVFVYTGSEMKLYVGGVLDNTNSVTGTIRSDLNIPLGIGAWYINPQNIFYYFDGDIDDIRIYNRALTDGEVAALYNEN